MKKKAKVGQEVEFTKPDTGVTGVGVVHSVDDEGNIQQIMLPEGEIIEATGLILTLIRTISRLFLLLGSIFSKKAKAKLRALRKAK